MATNALSRGWGSPPAPRTRIKTVILNNGVKLPVHVAIADLVEWLGNETLRRGYDIRGSESWGYAPRKIRGLEKRSDDDLDAWSNHAWGLAVDLNSLSNPRQKKLKTDIPKDIIELWENHGFRWGGYFTKPMPDPMHFEFRGTPTDAARITKAISASAAGAPTLRFGVKGQAVRDWQTILVGAGELKANEIDGVFGPKTEAATRRFQVKLGVNPDGVVGPKTHKATGDLLRWLSGS